MFSENLQELVAIADANGGVGGVGGVGGGGGIGGGVESEGEGEQQLQCEEQLRRATRCRWVLRRLQRAVLL